jgi:hypothetical protein
MSFQRSLALLSASALLAGAAMAQVADTAGSAQPGKLPVASSTGGSGTVSAPFLFSNGPFITGTGNGFGGANTSQIDAGYNTFGYGWQGGTVNNRVADNFTVPSGQTWTLSTMTLRGYQTNSTTTSTYTSVNVRIWNGSPVGGATVLFGDTTTNRLTSGTFSNVYRVTGTTLTNTQRPIMNLTVDMTWVPALPPGNYYVDVQATGSLTSGPWIVPTVPANPSSDNAEQFIGANNAWGPMQDGTALVAQDVCFDLAGDDGTASCPPVTNYCTALVSSSGCTPAMTSSGTPSIANPTGFTAGANNLEVGQNGLMFFGTTGQNNAPFFGGTLCVNPTLYRLNVANAGGASPCTGALSYTLQDILNHPGGGSLVIAGQVVNCQVWTRDPPAATTVSLSDGLEFTACP